MGSLCDFAISLGKAVKSELLNEQSLSGSQKDSYFAFGFPLYFKSQISTLNVNEWNVEN